MTRDVISDKSRSAGYEGAIGHKYLRSVAISPEWEYNR